ncbi:MAG: hypothetical protein Q4G63_10030 [Bacteroidia bacterium]|nr:hypothetical protein [Bacteroidia bacterium]
MADIMGTEKNATVKEMETDHVRQPNVVRAIETSFLFIDAKILLNSAKDLLRSYTNIAESANDAGNMNAVSLVLDAAIEKFNQFDEYVYG